jgi:serine/threonine protein phosphatase 1
MNKPKIFVIGDVHGCKKELDSLISRLPLTRGDNIIFLGDYIDRGPDSKGVIDTIIQLSQTYNVITLMGNHEQMFLDFFENKNTPEAGAFLYNGGTATLASYSDDVGRYEFPEGHLNFLKNLKLYFETEDHFFVHAGIPNLSIQELKEDTASHVEEVLWVRETFLNSTYKWDKTIVHGHTPVLNPTVNDTRINVDTGCVYDGKLTAIELPEKIIYSIPKMMDERKLQDMHIPGRRRSMRYEIILPVSVDIGENKAHFETINYSDHGMLIYTTSLQDLSIEVDQLIGGLIGKKKNQVPFTGTVIRQEKKSTGSFIAVEFVKAPNNPNQKLTT